MRRHGSVGSELGNLDAYIYGVVLDNNEIKNNDGSNDELFQEAISLVVTHQQGSISLLQRRLKLGYSRAARLMDEMEKIGVVGPFTGSKARNVLVDESYLEMISD